jgi:hypothetical protein
MEPVSTDVPRRFVSLRLALGFLLVLAVYGLVVADPLLAFSFPINPWDWTLYVVLCLLAFLLVFASCFFTFQFRRKEVVIFVAIGAIVCLSSSRLGGALLRTPTSWLYATGFRIHAWPWSNIYHNAAWFVSSRTTSNRRSAAAKRVNG